MAVFFPSLETIASFKVKPTNGEWTILHFLEKVLDDSYEVYFNPYLNGDRPDIIIMRQGNGVMIIEVKDWNLHNFHLNEKKKWVLNQDGSVVKSPIDQVLKYKRNLYDLHVDKLLEKSISNIKLFNIVTCAVYFHCASQSEVEDMLVNPYKEDRRYQDFLKYNIDLIGRDGLYETNFMQTLEHRYLTPNKASFYFSDDLYQNFKRILTPTMHMKSGKRQYQYTDKQKEIIYGKWQNGKLITRLEQRVRGVFGSGKTTVLAERAVQAYKRALQRNPNPKILILTYNITLKNFIHDKLNNVDEKFPMEAFTIINYHSFINAELNNLNIDIELPNNFPKSEVGKYLEQNYYDNVSLFEEHKGDIRKYDAVLIDEIQDYHRAWMEIIKNYFRDPQGDYVLFGDVKQNIYAQPTEHKDVITNVLGVNDFKRCFRSDFKICELAQSFQRNIFQDKYDIDDFSEDNTIGSLGLKIDKKGDINYMYLNDTDTIVALYNIIRGNIINKDNKISPNDITILGYTIDLLRLFDCFYRYSARERTATMFETIEVMYMTQLNIYGKNVATDGGWFNNICSHMMKKLFPHIKNPNSNIVIKLRQHIAKLFTIRDLYTKYPSRFKNRLEEECHACGISIEAYLAYEKYYDKDLTIFRQQVYNGDYKKIRENKKLHFWMNSGTIKISTINSFKGWESEVIFLIIEKIYNRPNNFNISFDELLYTGLTRCKRNLVIINFGNKEYDVKLRKLVEQAK